MINVKICAIILQCLGGVSMLMAMFYDSIPQAILGAMLYYHAITVLGVKE